MNSFTHLHVHTQYSILDGASDIGELFEKAKSYEQKALAITDHGNMFGVKLFHKTAKKYGIKPILGCEAYVAHSSRFDKTDKEDRSGDHLVILAKNKVGYHNLVKIISYSWTEGFYYKPRIDKQLLRKHHEGLIVSSACLGGEIPQYIMQNNLKEAERAAAEYKEIFGDDFYLEMMLHQSGVPQLDSNVYQNQLKVNKEILKIAEKLDIKYIATNDVHFVNKEDAEAHDILICMSTQKEKDDPNRMRYSRKEYLRSTQEMEELFKDTPLAISNTQEIADKIEEYSLDSNPIMPLFAIPQNFGLEEDFKQRYDEATVRQEFGEKAFDRIGGYEKVIRVKYESEYLRQTVYEGANKRWKNITDDIRERLDFELDTIKTMGFPGYFLIVWDFLKAAREMGVSVGPGRGSAAGSAVAYCLWITDIDPIKYDLLFERFLNPDRVSMPDIDIDFDDDGREQVMQWVVDKYGQKRVAHIITFGTMAAKMAIKDVARVEKLELSEADRLSKMIPEKPGMTIKKAYEEVPEFKAEKQNGKPLIKRTLELAETLEGSVRQVGVHACGIIIGKDDLENYIPLSIAKEAKLFVTQYDGKHVEDVGMLKMDFLGLKTLSIIKEVIENVKLSKGITLDVDNLPLDDKLTYELFSKGETTAIFQFESDGMKKYLKQLKPNRLEDLIAMNALYRPGPMDYIPSFVDRKHGREKIKYDVPGMEEYLSETYGITVYQEQVMLLSRKLAGFTKGMADSLRKGMGKKNKALIDELKPKFIDGCAKNNISEEKAEKIWKDWEAFASYAFNKSHSTCYAYIAYQTAYLKAHYPAEFMAAVLSRNLNDIKKVSFFMDECKRMGLQVLGPDVNESFLRFTVNKKGAIRFGLAAIKGVGGAAVENIIAERENNGTYNDIYNFFERVNPASINKRITEGLVVSGGFDNLGNIKRSQYFEDVENGTNLLESLMKYGNKMQSSKNSNANSLFGGSAAAVVKRPEPKNGDTWSELEKLNKEKELIGIYLSSHPLDKEMHIIKANCSALLSELNDLKPFKDRDIKIAGIVSAVEHKTTKTGSPWGSITIEDFSDSFKVSFFSKQYTELKKFLILGSKLFIVGRVEARYNNPQELEFKVKTLQMLSDMNINSLAVKIPINVLNEHFIEELHNIVEQNKGKADLKFLIYEQQTRVWVQLASKSYKIEVNNNIIDFLNENQGIEYKING